MAGREIASARHLRDYPQATWRNRATWSRSGGAEHDGALELPDSTRLARYGVGLVGLAVQQGELAKEVALAQAGEDHLAAVAGGQGEVHLAVLDEIETRSGLVLREDHLAPAVASRLKHGGHLGQVRFRQTGK